MGRRAGIELRSFILRARRVPPSGAILIGLIALGPLWTLSHIQGAGPVNLGSLGLLTLGRAFLIVLALVVVTEFVGRRGVQLSALGILFLGVLIALEAWVYVNASVWGCLGCQGSFGGLTDLIAASTLALVVLTLHPQLRGPVLLAIALACVLGALIAIFKVGEFVSGEPASDLGRLTGTSGNANFLAYALSPGIAVLLALAATRPAWIRVGAFAASAVIALALVLTYSRGGLIATAISAGAVIVLQMPVRWRLAVAAGLVVVLGMAAAVAAPAIEHARIDRHENVPAPSALLRSVDHSGWDGTPQGFISAGPAAMTNDPGKRVLRVTPTGPRAGVSYPWGVATPETRYTLGLQLRAPARGNLRLGLEDNFIAAGPAISDTRAGPTWRWATVTWRPSARSRNARLYVWRPHGDAPFEVRDVAIVAVGPDGRRRSRSISTVLLGSAYPREQTRLRELSGADERYFIPSRSKGVRLAVTAFLEHPVHGLGWEQFPAFAQRQANFGALVTHNEYLRFAAELGLPGFVLLIALAATVLAGLRSVPPGPNRLALIGVLIAGAVSLAFVNGLVTPVSAAWLAIACGVAVAPRPRSDDGRSL